MNQLSIGFDYGALDGDTRYIVRSATERIKDLERKTGESIIEIGNHLSAIKAALPHGQFESWLTAEFGWGLDTARRFMNVASVFRQKTQIASFQPSALYVLASGSVTEEVREEFVAKAEAGEPVRYSDVRARLDELKAPQRQSVVEPDDEGEEDGWQESPPLLSIVDTQTGEILRDLPMNGTVTVSHIPAGSMPEMRQKTQEEMAYDRLIAMSIIIQLDPEAVADAATQYRAQSARLLLKQMASLEAWAVSFSERLRNNLESPAREIRAIR